MTARASTVITVVTALLIAGPVVPAGAQDTLLSSSLPGAFGVRYLQDRAVVTYTVEEPGDRGVAERFRLRVRLPEPVSWGYLDREPIAGDDLRWDGEHQQAVLMMPFGSHRLHLGWAGEPSLPPERTDIPVFAEGEKVGDLTARFDLEGMTATGEVPVGPGTARVRVDLATELSPDAITFSAGNESAREWTATDTGLRVADEMLIGERPKLALHVSAQTLTESPVERVTFESIQQPMSVVRAPDFELSDDTILIEAEDYSDSGGTPPRVEPGSHHNTHGGSCVFSFIGDGSWLEWTFSVPEDGLYDLYARVSCGDIGAWRVMSIDGAVPEAMALVELPGTGGWGHADGEWWMVRFTGGEDQPAPLQLTSGEHTLRMTGVLTRHLNIDYIAIVPHQ